MSLVSLVRITRNTDFSSVHSETFSISNLNMVYMIYPTLKSILNQKRNQQSFKDKLENRKYGKLLLPLKSIHIMHYYKETLHHL